uniref:Uncharacterized protein n=1 Tax=Arion vulgaris TaxID=1028688 RepID=A0A0B7B9A2_9EUPU
MIRLSAVYGQDKTNQVLLSDDIMMAVLSNNKSTSCNTRSAFCTEWLVIPSTFPFNPCSLAMV